MPIYCLPCQCTISGLHVRLCSWPEHTLHLGLRSRVLRRDSLKCRHALAEVSTFTCNGIVATTENQLSLISCSKLWPTLTLGHTLPPHQLWPAASQRQQIGSSIVSVWSLGHDAFGVIASFALFVAYNQPNNGPNQTRPILAWFGSGWIEHIWT